MFISVAARCLCYLDFRGVVLDRHSVRSKSNPILLSFHADGVHLHDFSCSVRVAAHQPTRRFDTDSRLFPAGAEHNGAAGGG